MKQIYEFIVPSVVDESSLFVTIMDLFIKTFFPMSLSVFVKIVGRKLVVFGKFSINNECQ